MIRNQDAVKFILVAEAVQEVIVANMTIGQTKLFEATKVDTSKLKKLINIARSHIDALLQSKNVSEDDVKTVIEEIDDILRENRKYFDLINGNVLGRHQKNLKLDIAKDDDVKIVINQLKVWTDLLLHMKDNLEKRFNI